MQGEKHEKLTDRSHILKRPTAYIDDPCKSFQKLWVLRDGRFYFEKVNMSPGFKGIVKEIVSNALDRVSIDDTCTAIDIDIDQKRGFITVRNNGHGIPIKRMKQYDNIWLPEMLFTNLHTGSHFDDETRNPFTGGTYGIGQKATVVFSMWFMIETCEDGRLYRQIIEQNMETVNPPTIEHSDEENHTTIVFLPDYKRFDMKDLDDLHCSFIEQMAIEAKAIATKKVKITFCGKPIKSMSFKKYCGLFFPEDTALATVKVNDYWEICLGPNVARKRDNHISYVNGVFVKKGGTHIQFFTKMLTALMKEGAFGKEYVSAATRFRNSYYIFVKAWIKNPVYSDTQKTELQTPLSKFETLEKSYSFPDEFIKEVKRTTILSGMMETLDKTALQEVRKEEKKAIKRAGLIRDYEPALLAGKSRDKETWLLLTEGTSAKASAMVARRGIGVDVIGVYALRGKIMNSTNNTEAKMSVNEVIKSLKAIIGLANDQLSYDHIVLLTDADDDGFHIRGLGVLLFSKLLGDRNLKNLIYYMNTPLVTLTYKKEVLEFNSLNDLDEWTEKHKGERYGKPDYKKGLGSITSNEMVGYFDSFDERLTRFKFEKEYKSWLDLAFDKKQSNVRKKWLLTYDPKELMVAVPKITIKNFTNRQLIQYSCASNDRAIPNIMDGLKPSTRKAMWYMLSENIKEPEKVIVLCGGVTKNTHYHHGEASMCGAIVGLAQTFLGSNNLNLLKPKGQFGTRVGGGKGDVASPRYTKSCLEPWTKALFPSDDWKILKFTPDEGKIVEPDFLLPPLPLILVNGVLGIGTGYKCDILAYGVEQCVKNIKLKIAGEDDMDWIPFYNGFKGETEVITDRTVSFIGEYTIVDDNTIEITELPVGVWTSVYTDWLSMVAIGKTTKQKDFRYSKFQRDVHEAFGGTMINDITKASNDIEVKILVHFNDGAIDFLQNYDDEKGKESRFDNVVRYLNLQKTVTQQFVCFDDEKHLRVFDNVQQLFDAWFKTRLTYYTARHEYLMANLTEEIEILRNKCRFLLEIIEEKLIVKRKKKAELAKELEERDYKKFKGTYDYLLHMQIQSLTEEKLEELLTEREQKEKELAALEKTTKQQLWDQDIESFIGTL